MNFENKLWEKWSTLIGLKPIFLFKVALDFIETKNLLPEFEQYIESTLKNNKDVERQQ